MSNTLDPRPDLDRGTQRVRDGDSRTIWIVLGLVAVVAIIALAFVLTQNGAADHQAQLDQAAAQQHALDTSAQANAAATAGMAASAAGDAASRAAQSANASKNALADEAPPASQPAGSDGASTAPTPQ